MGIVKTKDLTFEYIRRDEEGNVEGITTAVRWKCRRYAESG